MNRTLAPWLDFMTGSARILRAPFRILRNGFKKSSRSANSLEKEEIFGKMPKTARKMQALPELRKRSNIRWVCWSGLLGMVCIGSMHAQLLEPEQISFTPGAAGTWNASWQGVAGRTYFSQWSTDLETWKYAPLMEFGAGAKSFGMATNDLPKFFMRLRLYDDFNIADLDSAKSADFDRDLLTNWQEISNFSTDPLKWDTDGDTLPDGWEVTHGLSPLDNGSINPANGLDGIFPGSTSTNGFAYINLPNVQNYNGGTLENFDGDLAPNDQDSDPTDRVVDWPPVAATSYAVIPLGNISSSVDDITLNSSGEILTSGTVSNTVPSTMVSDARARIWKNGTWSTFPAVTTDMLTFTIPPPGCNGDSPFYNYWTIPIYPNAAAAGYFDSRYATRQCGKYVYSILDINKLPLNCGPTNGYHLIRQFRWNTGLIPIPAPTKIFEASANTQASFDLVYTPGNQQVLYHNMNSDGSMAKVQRIKGVNGAPDISQTGIWFPPSYDPTSSYIPGEGSASLQLPNDYGVKALDASGAAVVLKPQPPGSNLMEYVLYDQGIQSPLPSDVADGFRTPSHYISGSSTSISGDGNMLNRIKFGPYNGYSRLLIGGKYVKKDTGINQRQKSPFTDAFTNPSSYEYKGTVTSVASNGVMMGSYSSKLTSPSNSPLQHHHAISRDGKTISLAEVVNPPPPSGSSLRTTLAPRYSNVIGHAMNDSGMMVVSADDAQNPIPPDANGIIKKSLLFVLTVELITDLNNDGKITAADKLLRDAAKESGASDEIKDKGTEFIFHNDTLSNGIWDKEDTDLARPATESSDDDAEEIVIIPGITEGQVWLEHPAITGLSFYKTRECNPADKVNLSPTNRFTVSATNPFPDKLFIRADGNNLAYPDADPQFEGDLVLKIKMGTAGAETEALRMKLTVVKDFGAKKYFQAVNDYIVENNTELFVHEKAYDSVFFRLCLMREEGTDVLPLELYEPARDNWIQAGRVGTFSAYTYRDAAGISEVMINNPNMTVVINGNQCGFTSGLSSAEAAAMSALGDPQITDKCQGRLKELNATQSSVSNDYFDVNTNIPGTQMKGSPLAGPDPLPRTTPPQPGGKYVAQYSDGKIMVGPNFSPGYSAPPNPSNMLTQMGGLSSSYNSSDRNSFNNSLVGTTPIGSTDKKIVFVIMGRDGTAGRGKAVELYNSAVSSGVPYIPGATTPLGSSPPITMVFLDSGITSCALAYKKPNDNLSLLYKGSKHNGSPYYTNTFLQFKSSKPRP